MAIQPVASSDQSGRATPVHNTPRQTASAEAVPAPASQPSDEQIRQAVQQMQSAVESSAHNLQFTIDKESGKTVVRVVDDQTQEVIRQIPSEEVIALSHALERLEGLLLQEKA